MIDDAGLIFREGNVSELSARILQLLDDPLLYARLATQGRKRVVENYTQQRIAQQTYEAYQEMIGE